MQKNDMGIFDNFWLFFLVFLDFPWKHLRCLPDFFLLRAAKEALDVSNSDLGQGEEERKKKTCEFWKEKEVDDYSIL